MPNPSSPSFCDTARELYTLRKQIREKRRALNPHQQYSAATRLRKKLVSSAVFQRSRHIAFYLANDGELDPALVIEEAWKRGKICYLPVLKPYGQKLLFARYEPNNKLIPNKFGIPEPSARGDRCRQAWALDLVITPLVAFDKAGSRLGMGGGYYDRTFAFLRHKLPNKPIMIGIAHRFQEYAHLPTQPWDIPLDEIMTD